MANATELNKGDYFLLNSEPVVVTRKEVVVVGTHSHSKLKIFFRWIAGGGEKSITLGHTDKVEMLDIIRKIGQVISKHGNKVMIMDSRSYDTFEACAESELLSNINENDEIIYIDYNGDYIVLEKR